MSISACLSVAVLCTVLAVQVSARRGLFEAAPSCTASCSNSSEYPHQSSGLFLVSWPCPVLLLNSIEQRLRCHLATPRAAATFTSLRHMCHPLPMAEHQDGYANVHTSIKRLLPCHLATSCAAAKFTSLRYLCISSHLAQHQDEYANPLLHLLKLPTITWYAVSSVFNTSHQSSTHMRFTSATF